LFIFQRIVQIHLNIYPVTHQFHRMRGSTAAIIESVIETTRRPGSCSSTTLSWPWANFLHQTCIAGLVKYLSPYTGRIADWMAFALSPVAHCKWITEGWCHCNKTHRSYSEVNPLQNVYFEIFIVWKLWLSYGTTLVLWKC